MRSSFPALLALLACSCIPNTSGDLPGGPPDLSADGGGSDLATDGGVSDVAADQATDMEAGRVDAAGRDTSSVDMNPIDAGPPDADSGKTTPGWEAVSVGKDRVCAISSDGSLYCWGNNEFDADGGNGKLGVNSVAPFEQNPTEVIGEIDSPVTQVSVGGEHACAVTRAMHAYCWGASSNYQSDPDSLTTVSTPRRVKAMPTADVENVLSVAVGLDHTCAARTDDVLCWGANQNAQSGGEPDVSPPTAGVRTVSTGPVSAIAAGGKNTCVLLDDGTLNCWGWVDVGIVTSADCSGDYCTTPTQPGLLPDTYRRLSLTNDHACVTSATIATGNTICWGDPEAVAEMPPGAMTWKLGIEGSQPLNYDLVADAPHFEEISAGWDHSCGIDPGGGLWCWGLNWYGEVGLEPGPFMNDDEPTVEELATRPQEVHNTHTWVSVSAGYQVTCAIDDQNALYCWGRNDYGELGPGVSIGSGQSQPVEIPVVIESRR